MKKLKIGNKYISNKRTYIIAEAGGNHYSDMSIVEKMIKEAAKSGADAIKFQTFTPEKLVTNKAVRPGLDLIKPEKLINVYRKTINLHKIDYIKIKKLCIKNKIEFLSTPFDLESVDLLEEIGISAYKIASGDITNFPLLKKVSKKQKPIFLSTGASNINEIKEAVRVIEKEGNKKIAILHCILAYPTPDQNANLLSISYLKEKFPNNIIGISDHSIADAAITIPTAAIAIGAKIIEKHFTIFSKKLKECDHRLSANPIDFKILVSNARIIDKALGVKEKKIFNCERKSYKQMRRSLVANTDLKKGHKINEKDIGIKRPGGGLHPKYFDKLIGKKLSKDMKIDEKFSFHKIA